MPRAHRHVLPGRTYHVTHRCHDRVFLLKFARDRDAYRSWLRAGLARSTVRCLSCCITSNHVHLLLRAADPEAVSELMQYVQGCSAQAYNLRKRRQGAFWSDRYHATMIEDGRQLWECLQYIDLNMVRAGVVGHPREWAWTGWSELMGERRRNRVLDLEAVVELTEASSLEAFRANYAQAIADHLASGPGAREPMWTESVAVGGKAFVETVSRDLTRNYRRRRLVETAGGEGVMVLREEAEVRYGAEKSTEKGSIAPSKGVLSGAKC